MATIKDIATKLGVSVSTVSKGLNGASDISEELRQLVLDTAVEMGYSTKRSRKEENRKLCIFIENMKYEAIDEFGYDIVLGFKQNAFKNKWLVDIKPITPEFQLKEKYDTYLLKNGYCGAFLLGFMLHDEWMNQLLNTTMPTVLLDNFIPNNLNVGYLGTDSIEGIEMAVRHLHLLGHKKIAFLNGSNYSLVADQRQEAFESAMNSMNLDIDYKLLARDEFSSVSAMRHVPDFLENGATAIVCGNDLIAQGVIDVCKTKGLSVPGDISVVGFDDIPIAGALSPALTTIRQDRNELGRCAYVTLDALIHHISISRTQLRPRLIERESTARVSGRH